MPSQSASGSYHGLSHPDTQCFHCHLPNPNTDFHAEIDGKTVYFCCPGCQAVTQMIVGMGLADYYEFRDQAGIQTDPLEADKKQLILDYNLEAVAQQFVHDRTLSDGTCVKEVDLSIDGISCAACVWLIEKDLLRLDGISGCKVNLSNHQARVSYDDQRIGLGDILLNLHQLGYQAAPRTESKESERFMQENRQHLRRLVVSGLGMMQVMMFAVALYTGVFDGMEVEYRDFLRGVSFLVSTVVLAFAGVPFLKSAWRGLKTRTPGMDLPVSIAILAAYFTSIYSTLTAGREVYFDSLCMFIFFLSASRFLEFRARLRANETNQHFASILPATASCLIGDEWKSRPIEQIEVGQIVRVRRGETVPLDGKITEGGSEFDEALLTGESRPVMKSVKDVIYAGSVNRGSPIQFEVSTLKNTTRLSAIVRLMEDAQLQKPQFVEFSQKVASWFVSILILLAVITFATWSYLAPENALWVTLSVLIVTCPCALSLAMPTVLTRAVNVLAKKSILLVNNNLLLGVSNVSDFVFDKTGTLTTGAFSLTGVELISADNNADNEHRVRAIAAALERHSEHPLANAFAVHANTENLEVDHIINDAHRGVEGIINQITYRIGRRDYVTELCGEPCTLSPDGRGPADIAFADSSCDIAADSGLAHTEVFLGNESGLVARFVLQDQLRPGSSEIVKQLERQGRVHILSGDSEVAVGAMAHRLGIAHFAANQTPENKLNYIKALQKSGSHVLFVGDGINDSPVLSIADCGLAMGSATDLARVSADGVLITDQLADIEAIRVVAKQSRRIIRQNIAWAVAYNLSTVPLAMLGYIPPYLAALGMSASSLLVTFNAMRIRL